MDDKKLKVFLVEDARQIRLLLTDTLQQTGCIDVVGFSDKESEALVQLRSCEWDIAIVDIGLREGNGLGVLAGLKSDNKSYGKRLVFTSSSSGAMKARTTMLGADAFFDKARDFDALVSHIQTLVKLPPDRKKAP